MDWWIWGSVLWPCPLFILSFSVLPAISTTTTRRSRDSHLTWKQTTVIRWSGTLRRYPGHGTNHNSSNSSWAQKTSGITVVYLYWGFPNKEGYLILTDILTGYPGIITFSDLTFLTSHFSLLACHEAGLDRRRLCQCLQDERKRRSLQALLWERHVGNVGTIFSTG